MEKAMHFNINNGPSAKLTLLLFTATIVHWRDWLLLLAPRDMEKDQTADEGDQRNREPSPSPSQ